MIEAFLLIPIAILGFLLWRADRRLDVALAAWNEERTALLQRIQAPELATLPEIPEDSPRHVPFDDDRAFHEASVS
jgi:hypothetical protein